MAMFSIQYNTNRYRPRTWTKRHTEHFGAHNEGHIVRAQSAEAALTHFAQQHNYNPFYLQVTEFK